MDQRVCRVLTSDKSSVFWGELTDPSDIDDVSQHAWGPDVWDEAEELSVVFQDRVLYRHQAHTSGLLMRGEKTGTYPNTRAVF